MKHRSHHVDYDDDTPEGSILRTERVIAAEIARGERCGVCHLSLPCGGHDTLTIDHHASRRHGSSTGLEMDAEREPDEPSGNPGLFIDAWSALTIGIILGGLIVLAVAMYFGPPPQGFAP